MMQVKLLCLVIALMTSSVTFGANDIPEKQLLQYKYVILIQEKSLDSERVRKIYYIENKLEMQKTVNWLKEYYPDRNALDKHMRAIMACCYIVFRDELYTSNADTSYRDGEIFFGMYMNFDIDGKIYFTKEQLMPLYKMFEEKGTPLKFDDTPKTSDK
ncbi:MAG: hypothetical protein WCI51_14650 [Lentisphaerota bacterium]